MSSPGVNVFIKNCYLVQGPMNKDYILYAVEIRTQRYMWTVFRRFTAFQRLYRILIQEGVPNIPPCPDKVMIYSNSGLELDKRRQELEKWLRDLLQNPYVQHVGAFQEFMRAEANIAPPNIKEVDLTGRIEDPNQMHRSPPPPQPQQQYYHDYRYGNSPIPMGNEYYASPQRGMDNDSPTNFEDVKDNTNSISLANFQIIKVIGKGSFGKVFQVCKKGTNEIYAMKVLRKSCIEKKHQIEHTKTERSILGKVTHPFIVNLRYAFQTPDKLYFVMDFCSGGELFYHLGRERKFAVNRAKYYAAEITLAIEHLHKNGVIYRDLKPENVLLTEEGHVCLTDFGLSKEGIHSPYSGAKSFCGTPEYLAPEILNRTGHGQAVDWWSLGALLYEMLTGWPPFYSKDQERLFNKIKKAPLEIPANIPADAKDLLSRLLERDVSKRLGSGPTDAEEIKSHPFFADIDWALLLQKKVPVPWVPPVQNATDTSQFSTEFTALPLVSPSSMNQSLHSDIKFQDFSYVSSLVNDTYADHDYNESNSSDHNYDMDSDDYDNNDSDMNSDDFDDISMDSL